MASQEELLKLYPSLNPDLFAPSSTDETSTSSSSLQYSSYKALVQSLVKPPLESSHHKDGLEPTNREVAAPRTPSSLKDLSALATSHLLLTSKIELPSTTTTTATRRAITSAKSLDLFDVLTVTPSSPLRGDSKTISKPQEAQEVLQHVKLAAVIQLQLSGSETSSQTPAPADASSVREVALRAIQSACGDALDVVLECGSSSQEGAIEGVGYVMPSCRSVQLLVRPRVVISDDGVHWQVVGDIQRLYGSAADFRQICNALAKPRLDEDGEEREEELAVASDVQLSRDALAHLVAMINSPYADTALEGTRALAAVMEGSAHREANCTLMLRPSTGMLKTLLKQLAGDDRNTVFFASKCLRELCHFMWQRDVSQDGVERDAKRAAPCLAIECMALTAMLTAWKRYGTIASSFSGVKPVLRQARSPATLCWGHTVCQLASCFCLLAQHPLYTSDVMEFCATRLDFKDDVRRLLDSMETVTTSRVAAELAPSLQALWHAAWPV